VSATPGPALDPWQETSDLDAVHAGAWILPVTVATVAETQRQHVPQNDAGELDTAVAFLTFVRQCVIKKSDGLSDEQLRRVLVPSGTSLLGLVQHLAVAERFWFGHYLVGSFDDTMWDFSMTIPAARTTRQIMDDYVAAISESDKAIGAVGDPSALAVGSFDGESRTLRWVLAHMTGETARHAGHADILREQIDGTTGR
jgi:hypothetical protein